MENKFSTDPIGLTDYLFKSIYFRQYLDQTINDKLKLNLSHTLVKTVIQEINVQDRVRTNVKDITSEYFESKRFTMKLTDIVEESANSKLFDKTIANSVNNFLLSDSIGKSIHNNYVKVLETTARDQLDKIADEDKYHSCWKACEKSFNNRSKVVIDAFHDNSMKEIDSLNKQVYWLKMGLGVFCIITGTKMFYDEYKR